MRSHQQPANSNTYAAVNMIGLVVPLASTTERLSTARMRSSILSTGSEAAAPTVSINTPGIACLAGVAPINVIPNDIQMRRQVEICNPVWRRIEVIAIHVHV